MNYKIVKELPKRRPHHNLKALLEEFQSIDAECIKIDPIKEGYKDVRSMGGAIRTAIKRHGFKSTIFTCTDDSFLYLSKKRRFDND